ncbi:hypothetical protein ABZX75_12940 [Streptomyces sp. NPDC003038]|uniref:hypothetical protein n=1 Tax=unclassified Streptomyces TaxID=2593676 RepID=UPI0033BD5972
MMASGRLRGSSGEWEKPFWHQRGWQVSAAFLVAIVMIGIVALVSGGNDDGKTPQGGSPTGEATKPAGGASSAPSGGTGDARPAGCRTDDTDQSIPSKAPADLQWKQAGAYLIPVSPSAGPVKYDGPGWSCFAHTPLGAVLAAHAISNHVDIPRWREVVDQQMAVGAGRDTYIEKRSKLPADQVGKEPPGSKGTYVGFSLVTYSKDHATVMVLMQIPEKGYATGTMSVVWEGGDWKLRPTLTGSLLEGIAPVGGTEGFTLWGASNGA